MAMGVAIFAALLTILLAIFVISRPAHAQTAPPAPGASWTIPFEPFRIADNLYYVGSADPTAYLIDTGKGLILLDVGAAAFAPNVLGNIKALGFDPRTITIILTSHAHLDHAGGFAAMKAATGAKLYVMAEDAPLVEIGGKGDPDVGTLGGFPPAKVDHGLKDGETVSLGRTTLTAHLTPGHTPGCTTWTMPVTVDGQPHTATFICSLTLLPAAPVTAARAALWRTTYAKLAELPCDLFLASHQGFYDGAKKRAAMAAGKPNPFLDPAGCKAFIDSHRAAFETRFKGAG
jgi:metallo-beta-lactamase class B